MNRIQIWKRCQPSGAGVIHQAGRASIGGVRRDRTRTRIMSTDQVVVNQENPIRE